MLRPAPLRLVQTAKVLVKTGDWNVICAVRDKAKMQMMADALDFPKGSYTIKEVDLRSLDNVRKFVEDVKRRVCMEASHVGMALAWTCMVPACLSPAVLVLPSKCPP